MIAAVVGLIAFESAMAAANENRQSLAIACTALTGFFVGWCELISIVMSGLVVPPETIGVAQAFHGSTRAVLATVASRLKSDSFGRWYRLLTKDSSLNLSRYR